MTRRWLRPAILLIPGALAVLYAAPAMADCQPHDNGVNSGSAFFNVGASGSAQSGTWDLGDRKIYLGVQAGSGMPNTKCQDIYFDWATDDLHYDQRMVRNCNNNSLVSKNSTASNGHTWPVREPSGWGGRDVNGMQKGAACVYSQGGEAFDACDQFPGHLQDCVYADDDAHPVTQLVGYTRFMVKKENGTIDYNSGGNVNLFSN